MLIRNQQRLRHRRIAAEHSLDRACGASPRDAERRRAVASGLRGSLLTCKPSRRRRREKCDDHSPHQEKRDGRDRRIFSMNGVKDCADPDGGCGQRNAGETGKQTGRETQVRRCDERQRALLYRALDYLCSGIGNALTRAFRVWSLDRYGEAGSLAH